MGRRVVKQEPKDEAPQTPPLEEREAPPASPSHGVEADRVASPGDQVTASWAEEIYTPAQFHTYKVGPFSATTAVLPGETLGDALRRATNALRTFAETERARKRESYLKLVERK